MSSRERGRGRSSPGRRAAAPSFAPTGPTARPRSRGGPRGGRRPPHGQSAGTPAAQPPLRLSGTAGRRPAGGRRAPEDVVEARLSLRPPGRRRPRCPGPGELGPPRRAGCRRNSARSPRRGLPRPPPQGREGFRQLPRFGASRPPTSISPRKARWCGERMDLRRAAMQSRAVAVFAPVGDDYEEAARRGDRAGRPARPPPVSVAPLNVVDGQYRPRCAWRSDQGGRAVRGPPAGEPPAARPGRRTGRAARATAGTRNRTEKRRAR